MKNLIKGCSILIIAITFATGCSDDPNPYDDYKPDTNFITETDITSELRNYLENGDEISLGEGTFYVSESIVVGGFCGVVQGHPNGQTRIEVTAGFKATSEDPTIIGGVPEGSSLTEIFVLYNATCDITFQNLTFDIKGKAPGELHFNPFIGKDISTIDNVIVVGQVDIQNTDITVTFSNLNIYGNQSSDAGAIRDRNLLWPLIVAGKDSSPEKINMVVENCLINNAASVAIEYWNTIGGAAEIKGNTIINTYRGIWLSQGMTATSVNIHDNKFVNMDDACLINLGSAEVCFMSNFEDGVAMLDDCL